MAGPKSRDALHLGFLAAHKSALGLVGGLLITNQHGRPLEFQCTSPVKPNRTQEILYGPTLQPFLMGELIGPKLIQHVSVKPHWVLTDDVDFLELRNHIDVPVSSFKPEDETSRNALSDANLRFHSAHTDDRESIHTLRSKLPEKADLTEPFERVREALREAIG